MEHGEDDIPQCKGEEDPYNGFLLEGIQPEDDRRVVRNRGFESSGYYGQTWLLLRHSGLPDHDGGGCD